MAIQPKVRFDERVRRSKERVLNTTCDLLVEAGFAGTSVDEIARRSGVSKNTIYRHWPSRNALLIDACYQFGAKPQNPNTGSLRSDLSSLLKGLAEQLEHARWPIVLPSVMDAAERDPELGRLHWEMGLVVFRPFLAAIQAGKERGELPKSRDEQRLLELLLAPLFFRRYHSKEKVTSKFLKEVLTSALSA